MSQKYFYKCALPQGASMGCSLPDCSFRYEVGTIFTARIPNSLLIGFRTLRNAKEFVKMSKCKIFRCLPFAPVIKINRLTCDYSYEGFANFWYNNRHLDKNLSHHARFEVQSPTGTYGCYKIYIEAEIKNQSPYY